MKKINFLVKLAKEGKLQKVEPSENVKEAYLKRSQESLSSAKALFKIKNIKDSVALAYYAMYHSLLALLFKIGIKCENHAAAILLLENTFEVDNTEISKAKSERVDKQYYVDFEIEEDEAKKAILIAEDFIGQINDIISKMNNEDIKRFQNKAVELFKK